MSGDEVLDGSDVVSFVEAGIPGWIVARASLRVDHIDEQLESLLLKSYPSTAAYLTAKGHLKIESTRLLDMLEASINKQREDFLTEINENAVGLLIWSIGELRDESITRSLIELVKQHDRRFITGWVNQV